MTHFRNLCFTLNNPEETEVAKIVSLVGDLIKYMIFGYEMGENGTPHLQGYMELTKQMRRNAIKDKINGRMHFERRYGSVDQAVEYCKKDGQWAEFGEKKRPGQRNDIKEIKDLVWEGNNMRQIIDNATSYQGIKCAETMMKYRDMSIKPQPKWVLWITGPTGSGKTTLAYQYAIEGDTWISGLTLDWFDGYDGQSLVIMDDIIPTAQNLNKLLRLLDQWEINVPVKGGFTKWNPKWVIITSVVSPEEVLSGACLDQLRRRITTHHRL